MGLKFNVASLRQELIYCNNIARKFLEPASQCKLKLAADQLTDIPIGTTEFEPWQIDKDDPIKIQCAGGRHGLSGNGKYLQGRLSFKWQLRKINGRQFELGEIVSTLIAIHCLDDATRTNDLVLQWHVDVVTEEDAPLPWFHIQVENPENLSVPRFPSFLFTPSDCLDFLLGEIFQQEWMWHQMNHSHIQRFAAYQKSRICRLITAQRSALRRSGSNYSSWITLKEWEPDADIFIKR